MAPNKVEFILGQYALKLELPDDFQEKLPISNFKEKRSAVATRTIQLI